MRDLLTGLAILLLLCLTGALVAPHFIDWDDRRDEVSSRISETLGYPVRVEGPISLELLPTPTLKLSHVRFGDNGIVQGTIGRFKMKLALPPIMRGEIRVTEATLQGASITVRPASVPRAAPSPSAGPAPFTEIGFQRLLITDTRLSVIGSDGNASFDAADIDGEIEATSLAGPFRGAVTFEAGDARRSLKFSTGRVEAQAMRLKALMENELAASRTEYDGILKLDNGRLAGEGMVAASGNAAIPLPGEIVPMIWRASAKVKGSGAVAVLDQLELAVGSAERQTVFTGNGNIDLSRPQAANIILSTRQLDLDRLFAPEGSMVPRRPVTFIQALAAGGDGLARRPILGGDLEIVVGSVLVGGDVIAGPTIKLRSQDGQIGLQHVSGELPGRTTLRLDATPSQADRAELAGRLQLESRDLAKLAGWFQGVPPRPMGLRTLRLEGDLLQTTNRTSISNATMVADDMRLSGAVVLQTGGQRPLLTLGLEADQLDVARIPELPESDPSLSWDLDLRVDARRVRFRGVGAGNITLRLRKEANAQYLDELRITDLGGANLLASGTLGGASPRLTSRLQATRLDALLELADRVSPLPWMTQLAERARTLAPADAEMTVAPESPGSRDRRLTLRGRFNGTDLAASARLSPDGNLSGAGALEVTLKNPRADIVARQVGLEAIPIQSAGPADLRISGEGLVQGTSGANWSLDGTIAGLALNLAARHTVNPAEPLAGRLTLSSQDLAPFAQMMLIAVPAVMPGQGIKLQAGFDLRGYRITLRNLDMQTAGGNVKGEIAFNLLEFGRVSGQLRTGGLDVASIAPLIFGEPASGPDSALWASRSFGPPASITLPGDLWIEAESVRLADGVIIGKPTFVLRFESGLVTVTHAQGEWSGGKLQAQATIRRSNQTVSATGRFGLEGWHIDKPLAAYGDPGVTGRASAQMEISATGESPAALVGALAGNGHLDLQGVALKGMSKGMLGGLLDSPARDFSAATPEALATEFQKWLKGSLPLPTGRTPIALGSGVLRAGPFRVSDAAEDIVTSLAVDLKDMTINGRAALVSRQLPKGWTGPLPSADILLKGPIGRPSREIDVSSLANGMMALAIVREAERIETIEQDQRERSYFNRRLRAAEEQRRAEEEQRRKDEIARLEAVRQEALRLEAARQEAIREEALRQQTLRQRIDDIIRNAPQTVDAPPSGGPPLTITPPSVR